jgi:ubiquinone/menaquinone biosynthesis C-methylase UbiE
MVKADEVKEYFDNTDEYLKGNPIIQIRKKIILELVGEFKDKQIIDIGCGNGELSIDLIKNNSITFLDISSKMLDLVRANISGGHLSSASFVNSDILNFKTDQTFDLVLCIGVIAHVDNISGLLEKLKEITKEDGTILLQYSASEKFISIFNRLKYALFSKDDYRYKINYISSFLLKKLINKLKLKPIKKVKYLPVSPLFSVFSYGKKIKYLNFFYKCKLFSFLNSEIILCLSKSSVK